MVNTGGRYLVKLLNTDHSTVAPCWGHYRRRATMKVQPRPRDRGADFQPVHLNRKEGTSNSLSRHHYSCYRCCSMTPEDSMPRHQYARRSVRPQAHDLLVFLLASVIDIATILPRLNRISLLSRLVENGGGLSARPLRRLHFVSRGSDRIYQLRVHVDGPIARARHRRRHIHAASGDFSWPTQGFKKMVWSEGPVTPRPK